MHNWHNAAILQMIVTILNISNWVGDLNDVKFFVMFIKSVFLCKMKIP